jgi:hypothetical protein
VPFPDITRLARRGNTVTNIFIKIDVYLFLFACHVAPAAAANYRASFRLTLMIMRGTHDRVKASAQTDAPREIVAANDFSPSQVALQLPG